MMTSCFSFISNLFSNCNRPRVRISNESIRWSRATIGPSARPTWRQRHHSSRNYPSNPFLQISLKLPTIHHRNVIDQPRVIITDPLSSAISRYLQWKSFVNIIVYGYVGGKFKSVTAQVTFEYCLLDFIDGFSTKIQAVVVSHLMFTQFPSFHSVNSILPRNRSIIC